MKKALLITTSLLVFFLTTGIASARVFFRLGVFPPAVIDPPVIVAPLRPITRILTAITARDIMVIGCGFPAIGTIYGPVTVGRKCGIQDTGSIVPRSGTDPIFKVGFIGSGGGCIQRGSAE